MSLNLNAAFTVQYDLSGVEDPTVYPVAAAAGSTYRMLAGGQSKFFIKLDNGLSTNWSRVADSQQIRKTKKLFTVQLDTPANPVIAPGASHTYVIDLGQSFDQIALADFEWVSNANSTFAPDAVVANASFPKANFGGVLIANRTPGGWVRAFEIDVEEFQNGTLIDVNAPYSADSSEVSAPLGYGSSALQVPMDHVALQTNPPKKLQIEDIYLSGNNLHVTIKNYDSVSINLSPYVGITRLSDDNRTSQLGAVSETGVIGYMGGFQAGGGGSDNTGSILRLSENGGRTFKTVNVPTANTSDAPSEPRRIDSIALTTNSTNTFLALLNYGYVMTGVSPDYTLAKTFNIRANIANYSPSPGGIGQSNSAGKKLDWKKTDTESCALFAGVLNYTHPIVFKSVDDCANFGSNFPLFDNNIPLLDVVSDVADFQNLANPQTGKIEPKVIDENNHFVSLQYYSQPELLNNGFPKPDVFVGAHTITGPDSISFQIRANEVAFVNNVFPGFFAPAPVQWKVQGSTLGNNVSANISSVSSPAVPLYYTGYQTIGAVQAQTVIQNMTFTAVDPGAAKNLISIEIVGGATVGSEFISRVGDAITIHIDDTVSTCQDVANVWTEADVTINISGFESNILTTSAAQNLSGGLDGVTLESSEVAILDSDFATLSAVVSDAVSTTVLGSYVSIVGIRAETISSVLYQVVKLANISDGSFSYVSYPLQNGGGSPIFGDQFNHYIDNRYIVTSSNKYYWVFNAGATTYTTEASPLADPSSTSPNLEMVFTLTQNAYKSLVLKTTDGGATWASINEDPEFRYAQSHIFHTSNDGQMLMLAAIRYWNFPGYEYWPYAIDKNRPGADVRFNLSTDGGTTWRNATGAWDALGTGAWNPFQGQSTNGQVMSEISGEVLAILFNYNNLPTLRRSLDSGITWSAAIDLVDPISGQFQAYGSDSKDQFMGFFGNAYQSSVVNNFVYYGSLVDKFTQWEAFGVK